MLYLIFDFFLIVIGNTFLGDLFNITDKNTVEIIEKLTEVSGFILVIIAVIKS